MCAGWLYMCLKLLRLGLVGLLLIGVYAPSVSADVYMYVDESGVINLTDRHPVGKKYRRLVKDSAKTQPIGSGRTYHPDRWDTYIGEAGLRYSVDPALVKAIIRAESNFNPYAVSPKGAEGLMQLMPATANMVQVADSFNPADNISGGVRYFRYLLDKFEGDVTLSLAAYNAGEANVRKYGGIPPFKETQQYVRRVLSHYEKYTVAIASR